MPADYKETLANNLCRVHGRGKLSHGRSGTILYLPCPTCLRKYGKRELKSQHLAVRLDDMVKAAERGEEAWVATCMKAGCGFKNKTLLEMPPISVRIPGYTATGYDTERKVNTSHPLMTDALGKKIPYPPGDVVPIPLLPDDHPAVVYLLERGYDIETLWYKYLTSYCTQELPYDKENLVRYRQLVGNWKSTPQGRIVFFAKKEGSITGWQSRLIDLVVDDRKYLLHHTHQWCHTETLVDGEWKYEPYYEEAHEEKLWPPPKYRNAIGQDNGSAIFGYDYLVEKLKDIPFNERYVVLCEGPLDAVRFGPFGIPLLGKSIQKEMMDALQKLTPKIIVAGDNDVPGKAAATRLVKILTEYGFEVVRVSPPAEHKDFGEMTDAECAQIIKNIKNNE